MKVVTLKELKQELSERPAKELLELCLHLSKFKKENKALLSYLLFESSNENAYILGVKNDIDEQFELINKKNDYLIKKQIRKILTNSKKQIRYSKKKETEVEILLYFCTKLKHFSPSIRKSNRLMNIYAGQLELIRKKITALHEDLQYDYGVELENLTA